LRKKFRTVAKIKTQDYKNVNFLAVGDLRSLNSVVAVFGGGVAIVLNFCNLKFL